MKLRMHISISIMVATATQNLMRAYTTSQKVNTGMVMRREDEEKKGHAVEQDKKEERSERGREERSTGKWVFPFLVILCRSPLRACKFLSIFLQ